MCWSIFRPGFSRFGPFPTPLSPGHDPPKAFRPLQMVAMSTGGAVNLSVGWLPGPVPPSRDHRPSADYREARTRTTPGLDRRRAADRVISRLLPSAVCSLCPDRQADGALSGAKDAANRSERLMQTLAELCGTAQQVLYVLAAREVACAAGRLAEPEEILQVLVRRRCPTTRPRIGVFRACENDQTSVLCQSAHRVFPEDPSASGALTARAARHRAALR
ncbi:hypothetical protein SAMN02982917_6421 [Azospirillum oryzae]|uniref:Uncharacterized protein n=1 Tax=Azospirillum oryzae TaxID=286727 RepID=A0A1X7HKT5_9PROT|nr:hypothetical protein SAMN02982917_6421 [Azospirillum oryzae]